MALTGIQIFKLLPKTNCKECGVPTCLAFAMNLASGKAELDSCPYVSDEAREQLSAASAPPIRPFAIGKGVRKAGVGGETVQYRHEKTFYSPTLLAAQVGSDIAAADLETKLKSLERDSVRTRGPEPAPRTGGRERRGRRCRRLCRRGQANRRDIGIQRDSDHRGRRRNEGRRGSLRVQAALDVCRHRCQCRGFRRHRQGQRSAPGHQGRLRGRPDRSVRQTHRAWV